MTVDVGGNIDWNEDSWGREESSTNRPPWDTDEFDACAQHHWHGNVAVDEDESSHNHFNTYKPLLPWLIGDLTNEVHPVFTRTNFPGANYEALLPAIRLASLFIDTDCLLGYWHALWFGRVEWVCNDDDEENGHLAYFRTQHTLSTKDIAMTRARLRTLAHIVRFSRGKGECNYGGLACGSYGTLGQGSAFWTGDLSGSITSVLYNEAMYSELCELDDFGTPETCMRLHFDFAVLLVHELAHASSIGAYGTEAWELPFEYRTMAEAGIEWEHYALGGMLWTSLCNGKQSISEWPGASIAK